MPTKGANFGANSLLGRSAIAWSVRTKLERWLSSFGELHSWESPI